MIVGVMPFICLGLGIVTGVLIKNEVVQKGFELASQLALMVLMFVIGLGAGIDPLIIRNLPVIGLKCAALALLAIAGSVGFVLAIEKTLLPLDRLGGGRPEAESGGEAASGHASQWSFGKVVPICLGAGILSGYLAYRAGLNLPQDQLLFCSLVVLYLGVGVSMGGSGAVLASLRQLGAKILLIPGGILAGSLLAGFAAAFLLRLPVFITVTSTAGMSYYSMTGAYMTEAYGAEAGTYGFLVNVLRELFTVLLLPGLARISRGSAVAAGAAGNMDTMLLPVINWAGQATGVIALLTGTVLTFVVPFLLPLLGHFLPFPG